MTARARTRTRSTAAAIALAAGITGASMLLTACGPTGDNASVSTSPSAAKAGGKGVSGAKKSATKTNGGAKNGSGAKPVSHTHPVVPALNGTAHNGLTISDGTRYVVMNGTRVDFGTAVRDLAWSPNGAKAAFIDGDGDLAVANPDGSGRVIVAKNPGNQTWSHPTWQVRAYDSQTQLPGVNNLLFAVRNAGVWKLYGIPASAHQGTPKVLSLNAESGPGAPAIPQTGNSWPNAAGKYGTSVYANAGGDVYIRDDYLRQQGSKLSTGSEPAMSPAADQDIVFVRSVGGHDHLFLETSTNGGPVYKDLTPHATTDYTEPAFSPDGKTIAARTPTGIVTLPANGSHAPVRISSYTGLPAYRG
ncbi:MAG TPA: hypothetical protein VGL02_00780 [Streptomyces sp.]